MQRYTLIGLQLQLILLGKYFYATNKYLLFIYPDSTHLCMAPLMNNIFFADVKTEGSSGEEDSDDDEGGPNNVEVSLPYGTNRPTLQTSEHYECTLYVRSSQVTLCYVTLSDLWRLHVTSCDFM